MREKTRRHPPNPTPPTNWACSNEAAQFAIRDSRFASRDTTSNPGDALSILRIANREWRIAMSVSLICLTEADTRAAGRRLASLLRPGDVVLLAGELGSGKTVFAGGIGEGLGVDEPVISPSYILSRRYEGLLPLVHADIYRLGSSAEIDDLDLLGDAADGVLVVEWGHAAEHAFGDEHLMVRIEVVEDGARRVDLEPHGQWRSRPLAEIAS
jgi:tRNA threonylcarbamoyladenosine biosynthesis protein TsaE